MKKQPNTTSGKSSDERKMKFAEAGILFVLVLAITVFVGVRMANHSGTDEVVEVAAVVTEIETPVETLPEIVEPEVVEAPVTEEPLAIDPPRIVTYAMAEQNYFDGNYTEAADMFDAYTADHSENAWGFFMLGLAEWKAGELDASEEAFIAALDIKPDHVKSLVNYSRVLIELERPSEARTQIELALQSAPENVDANRMYSRISHNEGQLDEAIEGYLKVLQIKPDDIWSLNNLGLIRIEQEQFEAALAPLAKAASLNTEVACIQNNLGVALERTGHYTAAAEAFEMALAADDSYEKADESLDRVSGLTEAADLMTIDLAALADDFSAFPTVVMIEAVEAEEDMVGEIIDELEIASSLNPIAVAEDPQQDGPQDQ